MAQWGAIFSIVAALGGAALLASVHKIDEGHTGVYYRWAERITFRFAQRKLRAAGGIWTVRANNKDSPHANSALFIGQIIITTCTDIPVAYYNEWTSLFFPCFGGLLIETDNILWFILKLAHLGNVCLGSLSYLSYSEAAWLGVGHFLQSEFRFSEQLNRIE